ncbi:MAG: hypothetical protein O2923_10810 [Verrucomicrobia bacterium]|nr:hypothetical protein [Verrucomicrobiota bacterium]MDA1257853.1 hypothetical protein [Chloroflexota bacterium]
MTTRPTWRRLGETAACQLRNGWLLIPITVALTIALLKLGLAASVFMAAVTGGAIAARNYRVTVRRKTGS